MARRARKSTGKAPAGGARRGRPKPEWKLVSPDELERYRQAQGLSKKAFAELLGVTNSTYHNWGRGIAVAALGSQRKLRQVLDGGAGAAPGAAAARSLGGPASLEVLTTTATIVNSWLQSQPGKLSPERLVTLIREVRGALS